MGKGGDFPELAAVQFFDCDTDPNLPGVGTQILKSVRDGKLGPNRLSQIANQLNAGQLLTHARNRIPSSDLTSTQVRGNSDINALVESGIFATNRSALQQIVTEIQFSHPSSVVRAADSSKAFVDALVASDALEADSELPDAILGRRDIVSDSSNAQFLTEAIRAGFFENRPDLFEAIIEKIQTARAERDANPAFREGNGYWENAMRKIEQPVVHAIAELGAPVRQLLDR